MQRNLIVNADDFGLSAGVNRGILEAAERGILTSASLMVRQPAATAAANASRNGIRLSVGLHFDLGEWVFRDGEWVAAYSVVNTDDPKAVTAEVASQLTEFRRLMGRNPTHLDSHQHVHRNEPVRSIVLEQAQQLDVPLRECTPGINFCGDFYGQTGEGETIPDGLSVKNLAAILSGLPQGITELGCHPGYAEGLSSVYRAEREAELRALCAPELRTRLAELNIELVSFNAADVRAQVRRAAPELNRHP